MSDWSRHRIPNNLTALGVLCGEITRDLEALGVPPDGTYLANLVVEELVSNTIKYGYRDPAQHWIDVAVRWDAGALEIEVVDDGHPFDPLEQEDPDVDLPAEERPIGGLGLHLVRQMSDTVTYAREDGRNRVCVAKRLK